VKDSAVPFLPCATRLIERLVPCEPLESDFCPSSTCEPSDEVSCEMLASVLREPLENGCCPCGTFTRNDGAFSFEPVAPSPEAVRETIMEPLVSWEREASPPIFMDKLIVRGTVMADPAAALPTATFRVG
jgi:hypothetical protein